MSPQLEAVIWDMDGVIVDTGIYHYQAWREAFARKGLDYTEEEFRKHFGQRNDSIIRAALGQDISNSEIAEIDKVKQTLYRQNVAANIKLLPGALRLIRALRECAIKQAIYSSAPVINIELILGTLKLAKFFQAIVSGTEVKEGKPSPQGVLLAAQKLGVKPENCLVIEDAMAGVAGAKKAGMKALAVTTTNKAASLGEADAIVSTLEPVKVADLTALFHVKDR